MIKVEIKEDTIPVLHCHHGGTRAQLMIEYQAVVTGMVKNLRDKDKLPDEEIEKLLVESIDLAFRVADIPGGVREA